MPVRNLDENGNPVNTGGNPSPPQPLGMTDDQLASVGQKYLGHSLTKNIWQNDPNYEQDIANSPEAVAYAASQKAGGGGTGAGQTLTGNWGGNTGDTRYQGLRKALASGLTGEAAVQAANAADGGGYSYRADANVYGIPGGQGYILQNGQGGFDWAPGDSAGSGTPATGSTPGTINGASSGQPDAVTAATQAAILAQLQQLQAPVDANSSTVTSITDPYNLQAQRGLQQTKQSIAEQAYANGSLNTGGFQTAQTAADENAAANEANFTGQTVATQEAQRQAMLQSMLGLGTNVSEFSQQLSATQKNFADQLAQQDSQFRATLASNIAQFGQSLGYQYALLAWSQKQTGINGSTTPVTGA
jgi:hypothetical protein